MTSPIIVALDLPSGDKALHLVDQLRPVVDWFKVGSELFTSAGPDIIRAIRRTGASVFLDLKFHDIPNTVVRAATAATRLDIQMMTLHTSGGAVMMKAAQKAVMETAAQLKQPPPLLLGVTVLTSFSGQDLSDVGLDANVGRQVERLAALCAKSGLRGLVCSPLELAALRPQLPEEMQFITPGIRTQPAAGDDQKRTLTARQAIDAGATYLVIGRPIVAANNPRAATEEILASLESR